jgi:hypothetical protein
MKQEFIDGLAFIAMWAMVAVAQVGAETLTKLF